MISRSVMKGNSKQIFHASMEARNKCFGHIECDAIIMDNTPMETMPALKALHPDAELTHHHVMAFAMRFLAFRECLWIQTECSGMANVLGI